MTPHRQNIDRARELEREADALMRATAWSAFTEYAGNIREAAKRLGLPRSTLSSILMRVCRDEGRTIDQARKSVLRAGQ